MELTGKCKEAFEKWWWRQDELVLPMSLISVDGCDNAYQNFITMPDTYQYGVYVDFFDSVGYYINVGTSTDLDGVVMQVLWKDDKITSGVNCELDYGLESINEARTKAIEKANELCETLL